MTKFYVGTTGIDQNDAFDAVTEIIGTSGVTFAHCEKAEEVEEQDTFIFAVDRDGFMLTGEYDMLYDCYDFADTLGALDNAPLVNLFDIS